jgi:hypothetical protein
MHASKTWAPAIFLTAVAFTILAATGCAVPGTPPSGVSVTEVGRGRASPLIPTDLVPFNSEHGTRLLLESNARSDYWPLSIYFVTQDKLSYCGVASSAMALNALGVAAPPTPEYGSHRLFTQQNFLNERTQEVVPTEQVLREGMTLDQLSALLKTHGVSSVAYHADEIGIDEFRSMVAANLAQPGDYVLVNYLRSAIGQETGGHISPLAAYHAGEDRFLILDVTRYQYAPVWVRTDDLWRAISTVDSSSGKMRGFVFVKK